jgi:hypothetical protein
MMQLHRANSMAARPSAARRAVQQAPGMHIRAPLQAPRLAQAAIARGRIAHVARAGKVRPQSNPKPLGPRPPLRPTAPQPTAR